MMDINFIPNEKTVVIPWWLDCRPWDVIPPKGYETNIRFRNCTAYYNFNAEHLFKDES